MFIDEKEILELRGEIKKLKEEKEVLENSLDYMTTLIEEIEEKDELEKLRKSYNDLTFKYINLNILCKSLEIENYNLANTNNKQSKIIINKLYNEKMKEVFFTSIEKTYKNKLKIYQ